MKFLIDAQLPRRSTNIFREYGFDAVHTLDLPSGNKTTDSEINDVSLRDMSIVVTKDADFVNSFLLHRKPYKLLLISTGNIGNTELEKLARTNVGKVAEGFDRFHFIELNRTAVFFHF